MNQHQWAIIREYTEGSSGKNLMNCPHRNKVSTITNDCDGVERQVWWCWQKYTIMCQLCLVVLFKLLLLSVLCALKCDRNTPLYMNAWLFIIIPNINLIMYSRVLFVLVLTKCMLRCWQLQSWSLFNLARGLYYSK